MPERARGWIAEGDALERAALADIRAELAAHLDLSAEALEAEGLSPAKLAARLARRIEALGFQVTLQPAGEAA